LPPAPTQTRRPQRPVEQTQWFHGTKADISDIAGFDPYFHGNPENLFGFGLYLTDESAVASGYAKTRGPRETPGKVMEVRVDALNTLDLDKPIPPDVLDDFALRGSWVEEYIPDPNETGREVIQNLRDAMRANDFPTSEATEVLGELAEVLKGKGYDGMRHVGGRTGRGAAKGRPEHNVLIIFDPNDLYIPTMKGQRVRDPRVTARTTAPSPPAPTQTPAFKRWFGESKVVDEGGEPLVVYHGTTAPRGEGQWYTTQPKLADEYAGVSTRRRSGLWQPSAPAGASVEPVYLSMKDPFVIDGGSPEIRKAAKVGKNEWVHVDDIRSWAKKQMVNGGHDGIIFKNVTDTPQSADPWGSLGPATGTIGDVFFVPKPTQIKSATGNVGTYGPTDPRFAHGIVGAAGAGEAEAQRRQQP